MNEESGYTEFLVEQDVAQHLTVGVLPVLAWALALAAVALVARRRWGARPAWTFLAASVALALAFAVTVVVVELTAGYLRSVPYGYGPQRQGEDYDRFVSLAHASVVAVYAAFAAVAVGLGLLLRRRFTGPGALAGVALAVAVVGFQLLVTPGVEFLNACYVGRPIVLDASC